MTISNTSTNIYPQPAYCQAALKSGPRRGEQCGRLAKHGQHCGHHARGELGQRPVQRRSLLAEARGLLRDDARTRVRTAQLFMLDRSAEPSWLLLGTHGADGIFPGGDARGNAHAHAHAHTLPPRLAAPTRLARAHGTCATHAVQVA